MPRFSSTTPPEYIAYLRGLAAERREMGFSGDVYEWRACQLERKERDRIAAYMRTRRSERLGGVSIRMMK